MILGVKTNVFHNYHQATKLNWPNKMEGGKLIFHKQKIYAGVIEFKLFGFKPNFPD